MNVLILTPDRVGSTLLQRLLTIYMLRKDFGRPVINLHELTNGLVKYYHNKLNQEVLGKPGDTDWGYFQSLPEVINLLSSVDHYKTSRLAHYHLVRRNDNINDQIKFYEYLNKNFYIIGCRRENLFEHALSWSINSHSKKLNVYSIDEKIETFQDIYHTGITVDRIGFEKHLNNYVEYIRWADTYFNVQSYFDYDTHITNIEDYILNLDFMKDAKNNRWEDMFNQSFLDWNTCHRMLPNLLLHNRPAEECTKIIPVTTKTIRDSKWNELKGPDWPSDWRDLEKSTLPAIIQQEIETFFEIQPIAVTENEYTFLSKNQESYKNSVATIDYLKEEGFLVTGVPIKLQSLHEKQQVVINFNDCVTWYNEWVDNNKFGKHYSKKDLEILADKEEQRLNTPIQPQLIDNVIDKFLGS